MFWGHGLQDSFCIYVCVRSLTASVSANALRYLLDIIGMISEIAHNVASWWLGAQGDSQGRKEHCRNNICSVYSLQCSPSPVGYQPGNAGFTQKLLIARRRRLQMMIKESGLPGSAMEKSHGCMLVQAFLQSLLSLDLQLTFWWFTCTLVKMEKEPKPLFPVVFSNSGISGLTWL